MFLTLIPAKRSLSFAILCMTCILLISGCSFPWRHHSVNASTTNIPKPTTQQLLTALQKISVRSVRFTSFYRSRTLAPLQQIRSKFTLLMAMS